MFTETDYCKLQQIMDESPEKQDLISRLLNSHQMTLSMIGHEIRNPLTLVYSTLQLIEAQHPEVLDFRYWSDLHHDIDYMILLLDQLSIYNNGERLNLKRINSNSFFSRLVLSYASSIINTKIQFVSQIAPSLPDILCDSVKLREVFLNLLNNACDAVSGSANPCIRLIVTAHDYELLVTIEDNGCGIPKEYMTNIFEPFITYKKNGTGLGLAITSRIIKAHNGTLCVNSELDAGTTFTFSLPVEKHT